MKVFEVKHDCESEDTPESFTELIYVSAHSIYDVFRYFEKEGEGFPNRTLRSISEAAAIGMMIPPTNEGNTDGTN